jgi:hypothetical protein
MVKKLSTFTSLHYSLSIVLYKHTRDVSNKKYMETTNKFTLSASNTIVGTFETAQDAMDYGNAYYSDGYSVK